MMSVLAGLVLLLCGWFAFRQVRRGLGYEGDLPPTVEMNDRIMRFTAPAAALTGLVLLVVGLASLVGDGGSESTDASPSESLELCTARLRLDRALLDLTTAPFSDGRGVVDELRTMAPPRALLREWDELLALLDMATVEAVHPDEVSDAAILEEGRRALRQLEILGIAEPCDRTGLPESFGCTDLEECAVELAASPHEDIATATVVAALTALEGWSVVDCSDLGGIHRCELVASAGQAQAEVEFGTTTDDRLFAWRIRIARSG